MPKVSHGCETKKAHTDPCPTKSEGYSAVLEGYAGRRAEVRQSLRLDGKKVCNIKMVVILQAESNNIKACALPSIHLPLTREARTWCGARDSAVLKKVGGVTIPPVVARILSGDSTSPLTREASLVLGIVRKISLMVRIGSNPHRHGSE